jgi:hypothetical protein
LTGECIKFKKLKEFYFDSFLYLNNHPKIWIKMGNIIFAENNPLQNNTFLFCYQDDNDIVYYYTLPLDVITPKMQEYIDKFSKYGNNLKLQCFNMVGYTGIKPYPEWRFEGIPLPHTIFEDYVNLKRLIKSHPKSKLVTEQYAKKMICPSLTIKMMICFKSLCYCETVRKSLSWE